MQIFNDFQYTHKIWKYITAYNRWKYKTEFHPRIWEAHYFFKIWRQFQEIEFIEWKEW